MVARGAFDGSAWERVRGRLERHGGDRACDPIEDVGYPRIFPDSQHAYWFYPFDPTMPNLPSANDPATMAGVLLGLDEQAAQAFAAAGRLNIERVRYVPEVGAIPGTIDTGAGSITMYGRSNPATGLADQPDRGRPVAAAKVRGALLYAAVGRVRSSASSSGVVPGKPVGGNRLSTSSVSLRTPPPKPSGHCESGVAGTGRSGSRMTLATQSRDTAVRAGESEPTSS
jgi:hypothetical protein